MTSVQHIPQSHQTHITAELQQCSIDSTSKQFVLISNKNSAKHF